MALYLAPLLMIAASSDADLPRIRSRDGILDVTTTTGFTVSCAGTGGVACDGPTVEIIAGQCVSKAPSLTMDLVNAVAGLIACQDGTYNQTDDTCTSGPPLGWQPLPPPPPPPPPPYVANTCLEANNDRTAGAPEIWGLFTFSIDGRDRAVFCYGKWTLVSRIIADSRQHLHAGPVNHPLTVHPAAAGDGGWPTDTWKLKDTDIQWIKERNTGQLNAHENAFKFWCASANVGTNFQKTVQWKDPAETNWDTGMQQYFSRECLFDARQEVGSQTSDAGKERYRTCNNYGNSDEDIYYVKAPGTDDDCGLGSHLGGSLPIASYGWNTCGDSDPLDPLHQTRSASTGCGNNGMDDRDPDKPNLLGGDGLLWVA